MSLPGIVVYGLKKVGAFKIICKNLIAYDTHISFNLLVTGRNPFRSQENYQWCKKIFM
jgi:hypothetical protein